MVYERAREKSDTMRGCFCGVLLSAGRKCVSCGSRHLCKRGNHASFFQRGHGKCGKGGKAVAAFDNMRLQSGYYLETEAASYAGLALDDVKAVKMDELSKGEIRKKGKQLELLLSEGSLLCDVTAPLKGEESLSIRTSTMITGIRGTVVYAEVVDSNTSRVCVLEGQVLVRPVNPVEGDRNGQYIEKGRQALIIGPDRMERKGEIQTLPLTKTDIAPYVL